MKDDEHRLCHIERDVAVLNERGVATAMALVLAEKLAAADRKLIIAFLIGAIGWVVAILGIVATVLISLWKK